MAEILTEPTQQTTQPLSPLEQKYGQGLVNLTEEEAQRIMAHTPGVPGQSAYGPSELQTLYPFNQVEAYKEIESRFPDVYLGPGVWIPIPPGVSQIIGPGGGPVAVAVRPYPIITTVEGIDIREGMSWGEAQKLLLSGSLSPEAYQAVKSQFYIVGDIANPTLEVYQPPGVSQIMGIQGPIVVAPREPIGVSGWLESQKAYEVTMSALRAEKGTIEEIGAAYTVPTNVDWDVVKGAIGGMDIRTTSEAELATRFAGADKSLYPSGVSAWTDQGGTTWISDLVTGQQREELLAHEALHTLYPKLTEEQIRTISIPSTFSLTPQLTGMGIIIEPIEGGEAARGFVETTEGKYIPPTFDTLFTPIPSTTTPSDLLTGTSKITQSTSPFAPNYVAPTFQELSVGTPISVEQASKELEMSIKPEFTNIYKTPDDKYILSQGVISLEGMQAPAGKEATQEQLATVGLAAGGYGIVLADLLTGKTAETQEKLAEYGSFITGKTELTTGGLGGDILLEAGKTIASMSPTAIGSIQAISTQESGEDILTGLGKTALTTGVTYGIIPAFEALSVAGPIVKTVAGAGLEVLGGYQAGTGIQDIISGEIPKGVVEIGFGGLALAGGASLIKGGVSELLISKEPVKIISTTDVDTLFKFVTDEKTYTGGTVSGKGILAEGAPKGEVVTSKLDATFKAETMEPKMITTPTGTMETVTKMTMGGQDIVTETKLGELMKVKETTFDIADLATGSPEYKLGGERISLAKSIGATEEGGVLGESVTKQLSKMDMESLVKGKEVGGITPAKWTPVEKTISATEFKGVTTEGRPVEMKDIGKTTDWFPEKIKAETKEFPSLEERGGYVETQVKQLAEPKTDVITDLAKFYGEQAQREALIKSIPKAGSVSPVMLAPSGVSIAKMVAPSTSTIIEKPSALISTMPLMEIKLPEPTKQPSVSISNVLFPETRPAKETTIKTTMPSLESFGGMPTLERAMPKAETVSIFDVAKEMTVQKELPSLKPTKEERVSPIPRETKFEPVEISEIISEKPKAVVMPKEELSLLEPTKEVSAPTYKETKQFLEPTIAERIDLSMGIFPSMKEEKAMTMPSIFGEEAPPSMLGEVTEVPSPYFKKPKAEEEEIYVSPFVTGKIEEQIQSLEQITSPITTPTIIREEGGYFSQIGTISPKSGEPVYQPKSMESIIGLTSGQILGMQEELGLKQVSPQAQKQYQTPMQQMGMEQVKGTELGTGSITGLGLGSIFKQKQAQEQVFRLGEMTKQKTRQRTETPQQYRIETKPRPKTRGFGLPSGFYMDTGKGKAGKPGYDVLVKARQQFGGKKTGKGGWEKISSRPLTEEAAKSLMGSVLKQTAKASGKIVPTEGVAQESTRPTYEWGEIKSQFYQKAGDIFVQKPKYRIGTPGEKKEITFAPRGIRKANLRGGKRWRI